MPHAQKQAPIHMRTGAFLVAERVGFEPTIPRGDTRSPGARTRPDYATSPRCESRYAVGERRRGRDSNPRGRLTLRVFETRALGQLCDLSRRIERRSVMQPTPEQVVERVIGLEPTTYSLGSCRSTTELHPQNNGNYRRIRRFRQLRAIPKRPYQFSRCNHVWRFGPADWKSGLEAFGRLSACADRSSGTKNVPGGGHAAERPQT